MLRLEGKSYISGLAELRRALKNAGIADFESDARLMVLHTLGLTTEALYSARGTYDSLESKAIESMAQRRMAGEPVQYITGRACFYGLEFAVHKGVLIPRRDTEALANLAVDVAPEGGDMLDLCTGSGCVAIAVKNERPDLDVTACDISDTCVRCVEENAQRLGINIRVCRGDLFSAAGDNRYDVITANPPYIPMGQAPALMREVRDHEPKRALFAGEDGLDMIRRITHEAGGHLKSGGMLIMEFGFGQQQAVGALMESAGFKGVLTKDDMEGRPRVVFGRKES